jgi:hypothetical protein
MITNVMLTFKSRRGIVEVAFLLNWLIGLLNVCKHSLTVTLLYGFEVGSSVRRRSFFLTIIDRSRFSVRRFLQVNFDKTNS